MLSLKLKKMAKQICVLFLFTFLLTSYIEVCFGNVGIETKLGKIEGFSLKYVERILVLFFPFFCSGVITLKQVFIPIFLICYQKISVFCSLDYLIPTKNSIFNKF
jgi:hypothetical protein